MENFLNTSSPQEFAKIVGLSFAYGLLMWALYKPLHERSGGDSHLARSFPLISPAVSALFFVVRTNLPLSLGLLGALSIVRFRTPVKRAEDIGLILLVIAGGIACSVSLFWAPPILATISVLFGLIEKVFGNSKSGVIISLRTGDRNELSQAVANLKIHFKDIEQVSVSESENLFVSLLRLKKLKDPAALDKALASSPMVRKEIYYSSTENLIM